LLDRSKCANLTDAFLKNAGIQTDREAL